ncbi:alkaline phosphatase family protein [Prolixibacter bellariivorans]|uniref:Alkaline phosphatase family protein n=1 Tax=Prolixibacter bellariivorans TaxID=314319 RepID=A0A5M4B1L0_9BACT|nr:alkaline phosphatase PafA [Prolixibacter bellariivorans]GET34060.1 alkaline phosphatase family protein [Prolixibacter bellariivorans]
MKLVITSIAVFLLTAIHAEAKAQTRQPSALKHPKLVVGIVVDQMRYDYLAKYYNKFSDGGFKKLMNQGFNCKDANFNYAPTYTGPGHTSIYTGTTPAYHGIIGNNWYNRTTGKTMYVTDDASVQTVGSNSADVGKMSPRNMLASTIGDEARLFSNMKSKVISISLKDRAAILPGGHLASGAFWFDPSSGNFVTSTYYMNELPKWVRDFNAQKLPEKYLSKPWNTLLPISEYTESAPDDNPYEGLYKGETKPVFPHNLPAMYSKNNYGIIRSTPFGNSLTKDLALAALKGANLGKGNNTDFLMVSFSSTDYIGHKMGPQSVELEDTYLRLDRDLAQLISVLDKTYGKDNYLLFLTADHGAAYVPQQLMDHKMDAGYFSFKDFDKKLKAHLAAMYNDSNLVSYIINDQVYLNHPEIHKKQIGINAVAKEIARYAQTFKGVANAYTAEQLTGATLQNQSGRYIQNGFYVKRSGDVSILLDPQWLGDYPHTGTSHGTTYSYDTHVPLLWYGWHIKPGYTSKPVHTVDIAPTLAAFLNIDAPNACTGRPIVTLTK